MRYVHPAAEQKRLAACEQAAEHERLAATKLETFRINGSKEAASEQAVGARTGTEASDKLMDRPAKYLKNLVGAPRFELWTSCAQGNSRKAK